MKIKVKIDIPRYNRDGEVLDQPSVIAGRTYEVMRKLSPSIYVIKNECGMREMILIPSEGRLIKD